LLPVVRIHHCHRNSSWTDPYDAFTVTASQAVDNEAEAEEKVVERPSEWLTEIGADHPTSGRLAFRGEKWSWTFPPPCR
jgi:hypothetical protein